MVESFPQSLLSYAEKKNFGLNTPTPTTLHQPSASFHSG